MQATLQGRNSVRLREGKCIIEKPRDPKMVFAAVTPHVEGLNLMTLLPSLVISADCVSLVVSISRRGHQCGVVVDDVQLHNRTNI
jgi:hypothetical protein